MTEYLRGLKVRYDTGLLKRKAEERGLIKNEHRNQQEPNRNALLLYKRSKIHMSIDRTNEETNLRTIDQFECTFHSHKCI